MKNKIALSFSITLIFFSFFGLIAIALGFFLKPSILNFSPDYPGKVEYVFSSKKLSHLDTSKHSIKEKKMGMESYLPDLNCEDVDKNVDVSDSDSFAVKGLHCNLIALDNVSNSDVSISNIQFFQEIDSSEKFVFLSANEVNYFYEFIFNYLFHAQEIWDLKGIYLSVYDADSGVSDETEAGHYNPSTKTIVIKIDSSSYNKSVKELSTDEKIMSIWGVLVHEYGHHFFENYYKRMPWKYDINDKAEKINVSNISIYNKCNSSILYKDSQYDISKFEKYCSDSYINKRTTYELISGTGNNYNKNTYSYNFKSEKLPEQSKDFEESFDYSESLTNSVQSWIYNYSDERYKSSNSRFNNAEYYHSYDEIFARNFMMSSVPSIFNFVHEKKYSISYSQNKSSLNCSDIYICVPYDNWTRKKNLASIDPFFLEYWKNRSMNESLNSPYLNKNLFLYDKEDQSQENKILSVYRDVTGQSLPVSYNWINLVPEDNSSKTSLLSSYSGWSKNHGDLLNITFLGNKKTIKPFYNSDNFNYVSNIFSLKESKNWSNQNYKSSNGLRVYINNNINRNNEYNDKAYFFSLINIKSGEVISRNSLLQEFANFGFEINSFKSSITNQDYDLFNSKTYESDTILWNQTFGQYNDRDSSYIEIAKNILPNSNGSFKQFLRSLGDGRYESKIYWLGNVLKYDPSSKSFIYDML